MTKSRGIRARRGTRQAWVADQQGKHVCACGCGEAIVIQPGHFNVGIPTLRHGHNARLREWSEGVAERFWNKVDTSGECWLWVGTKNSGYGAFSSGGSMVMAHRWAYEHIVGQIPEGMQIDHLCMNPSCVRPEHLEPVTPSENIRRSYEYGAHKKALDEGRIGTYERGER